ncbi:MAG: hypothetical protein K2G89_08470 [Lachnospiraceae bacterium]|nr:hypothetical protein [Lachnospiraceae bacterium]
MDESAMIDDLIAQLDADMSKGAGHINVDVDEKVQGKEVESMGCIDCSKNSFACAVPTLDDGSDDLPIE